MHYSYRFMQKKSLLLAQNEKESAIDMHACKKLITSGFQMQEEVEYTSLLEDLSDLEAWCEQNNTENSDYFFQFYQDAVIGAYYRYLQTKGNAWSSMQNAKLWIGSALFPILSSLLLQMLTHEADVLLGATGLLATSVIGIIWLVSLMYQETAKKRAYDETWVRHSICYNRLHLALSAFLSSDRTKKSFGEFINAAYNILDQNLDQFALNLSSHGIAPREKVERVKGGK